MKTFLKGLAVGYSVGAIPVATVLIKEIRDHPENPVTREEVLTMAMAAMLWPSFFYFVIKEVA